MKRRRIPKFYLCCLLLLLFGAAARAEFRVVPVDPGFLEANGDLLSAMISGRTQNVTFEKMPEGVSENNTGRMTLPSGKVLEYATYQSEGNVGSTHDKIIFDLDGDKDLTDEKTYELDATEFKEIALKLPGGKEFRASYQAFSGMLRVRPAMWLKGTINVEGREVAAVLIDTQFDGFAFGASPDMLLIDRNGDGKFDVNMRSYEMEELSYLQSEMLLGGKLYNVKLDTEKLDLRLSRYEGETGRLTLDLQVAQKPKQYMFLTYTLTENGVNMLTATSEDFPMELKTGEFKPAMLMLVLIDQDGRKTMIQAQTENALNIEAGKTTTLKLGAHGPLELIVGEKGGKLTINQKLAPKDGITYSTIGVMPEEIETAYTPNGGQVKVFSSGGELLTEGTLEYG